MALLVFPSSPSPGQLYPAAPVVGQYQYVWSAADSTWRIVGVATGVIPGIYGDAVTIPQFTVNAVGTITAATNIPIPQANTSQRGLVQLVDDTVTNDTTKALTAAQGFNLQNQIGDVALLNPPAPDIVTAINNAMGPTGVIPGVYGDAITIPQFTVSAFGTLTSVLNIPIPFASTTQIGLVQLVDDTTTNDATKALTAAQGFYLQSQIGDLTLLNPPASDIVTAINNAVGPTGVTAGTYGDSLNVGQFTVDSQGQLSFAQNVPIATATTASLGVVQLATDAETQSGVNSTKVVTPSSLQSKVSDSTSLTSSTTIASSTAVKTAWDLANAAIPKSTLLAKGSIVGASSAGTPVDVPVGTNGQYLKADSGTATGLSWGFPQFVQYDDISGGFDGNAKTFNLTVSGVATPPNPTTNIMVFVGGVAQIPGASYGVAGSVLTFVDAPPGTATFYAVTVA